MAVLSVAEGTRKAIAEAERGSVLSDTIRDVGMFLPMPCGGRGRCGKCVVWTRGDFAPPSGPETALIGRCHSAGPEGYAARIACMCRAAGDGEVVIPERRLSIAGVSGLPSFAAGRADSGGYGIAVDIGTTAISALLCDLSSGGAVASIHEMNRQAAYGADVLSRIDYSCRNGPRELNECLAGQLAGMFRSLVSDAGISAGGVKRIVAAGNTTMLHFLTNLDPRGIGTSPFTPASLFGDERRAGDIFPEFGEADMYIPPSVSAYVGGDITSGMIATDITGGGVRMLIDVGTNGEMALRAGPRVLCCSTAAGPAFEGAAVEMGMPAVSGAVSRVFVRDGAVGYETVDGVSPTGICGSGMISAVDVMLRHGILSSGGKILETGHKFTRLVSPDRGVSFMIGDSGVCLTQRDIRNIQLAKASIAAGANVLLKAAGIGPADVEALYLCGGFGSAIDPEAAAGIGIFPREMAGCAAASGNTALLGAARLLFSRSLRDKIKEMAAASVEISLSSSAEFMEEYVARMPFGDSVFSEDAD